MTLETPFHIQRRDLIGKRHQVNSPVTGRAADALVYMNAVIEINEVGKIVHSSPLDRLARPPAFADRLEIRAVRPDLRMAIHTGLSRRNACVGKLLDGGVAVTAIDAVISDVMFMTELNGLFAGEISLSVVGGPVEFEQEPDDYCDEENRAEDANFRDKVGTSMKDLTHRSAKLPKELENCSRTRARIALSISSCGDHEMFQA